MRGLRACAVIGFATLFLSGCNSYSYKPVATNSTSEKVRLVTIQDSDGVFVGERYEMFDVKTSGWYESEKTASGSWDLTSAGARAKAVAEAAASSSSSSGSNGGGGSC